MKAEKLTKLELKNITRNSSKDKSSTHRAW